jgi:catechol 2,3-dioxygenase-like lactoylglutathione lyase family enzyme
MTTTRAGDSPGNAAFPFVHQVVLDCPRPRALAEFYRELLGYSYRAGDEAPPVGDPDHVGQDWLVLRPDGEDPSSGRGIAFQRSEDYVPPVWSGDGTPLPPGSQRQMLHLDMAVPDVASLTRQRDRATGLGATILLDRSDDDEEPLYVFADPAGHPFCIFVG